jgi:hypothetical protein
VKLAPSRTAAWAAAGLVFILLATANAGGYRYGGSDLAFHVPAVIRALNPETFPRDAIVIDAQARLMITDEALAAVIRATGASIEWVFFASYLVALVVMWTGVVLVGGRLYRTPWATVALAAIVTLRHRIPRTSVNSFEPYFNPRMLAFGCGLLAIAALLRRRTWSALALVAVAAALHLTTGLWFGILIGVAVSSLDPRLRRPALAGGVALAAFGAWAVTFGPLAATMTRMDAEWLAAIESKDDLFPSAWPAWVWCANLALPAVLWLVHRARTARGDARPEDGALVWGALALTAVFLATVPASAARWALPTELQASRAFWPIDFLTAAYLVALASERAARLSSPVALRLGACALAALSLVRGVYVMRAEFPDRPLFAVHLRQTPWQDAMDWLKRQPLDVHVLADPGHAWKYGTSVRVAAGRDVFLEDTKDSALAIYSRPVAQRVVERRRVLGAVDSSWTAAGSSTIPETFVRQLADGYGVDYLVTEATLPLQLAFGNSQFHVYALSPGRRAASR